jgi:hypothetical protein
MPSLLSVSLMRSDVGTGRSSRAFLPALLGLLVANPGSTLAQASGASPEQGPARNVPASSRPILLVRTAGDSEVMDPVRLELLAYGWRVIEVPADEAMLVGSLAEAVSGRHVTAAVRVDVEKGQIEIHIARSWGNVQETLRSEGGKVESQILALRVTEALRAHGLDLGPAIDQVRDATPRHANAPPPKADSPTPATPRTDAEPAAKHAAAATAPAHEPTRPMASSRGIWLELAPSILASPGGFGLDIAGLVGLRLELSSLWSLSAIGTVPFGSHAVNESEGSATATLAVVGGAAELVWLRRPSGSAALGLGASAVVMSMRGTGNSGYQGARDTVLTQAPQGYLRFAGAQYPNWHFFGVLIVGVAVPTASLRFAEREVRTWGAPFFVLGCGGEFRALNW